MIQSIDCARSDPAPRLGVMRSGNACIGKASAPLAGICVYGWTGRGGRGLGGEGGAMEKGGQNARGGGGRWGGGGWGGGEGGAGGRAPFMVDALSDGRLFNHGHPTVSLQNHLHTTVPNFVRAGRVSSS